MNLSELPPIVVRSKKRIGRGHGSGKVKTAGRGQKGQKARGTIPPGFEGGQLSIIKRLPLLRGKGKNKGVARKPFPIAVERLQTIPAGAQVTLDILRKYHMIDENVSRVKILGKGAVTHKLTVMVPCSAGARQAIQKAGGEVKT